MRPSRPPGRLAALIALSVAVGLAPGASARTGASGEAGSGPGPRRPAAAGALSPAEPPEPDLLFDALPKSDRFWPYANVAVKLGWMTRSPGKFLPDGDVTTRTVHRAP